jgi:hypothetical protein
MRLQLSSMVTARAREAIRRQSEHEARQGGVIGSVRKRGKAMMFQRERQRVVVETNLDEVVDRLEPGLTPATYRVHAKARFIDIERHGEAHLELPVVGDPWDPLTVRARLERVGETMRRLPKPGPRKVGNCMPETLRERWKDAPKEEATDEALDDVDVNAAYQVIDVLPMGLGELDSNERRIAWAIAQKRSDRWVGRRDGCDGKTAAARKQTVLKSLAEQWNKREWRPDAEDVKRARKYFLHRKD